MTRHDMLGLIAAICVTCFMLVGCEGPTPLDSPPIVVVPFDASTVSPDEGIPRPEARFNSARPNRLSTEGGTRVTIIGRFFDDETQVSIDGQPCAELEQPTTTRVSCTAPPRPEPGPGVLLIEWSDGHRERYDDILSYYVPLSVSSLMPDRVRGASGETVLVTGTGFVRDLNVRLERMVIQPQVVSDTQFRLNLPRLEAGLYDLQLSTADESLRIPDALTVVKPLLISDTAPAVGPVTGGEQIRISGVGLSADSEVLFGTRPALISNARDDETALFVESPIGGSVGFVDITISNVNGVAVLSDGYLYTSSGGLGFEVSGLIPNRLPTTGGEGFWIGGNGFDLETRVFIDGRVWVGCQFETTNRLFCDPGPRLEGESTVVVESGTGIRSAELTVEFYEEPLFYNILPDRGLVSGGTLVDITGRGFTPDTRVWFDDFELSILSVSNELIRGLTPAGAVGRADLRIEKNDVVAISPDAFQYIDTGISFGGAWGNEVDRNLNVSVYDNRSRQPVNGASVRVSSVTSGQVWIGRTDQAGQAVIAGLQLGPPLDVTVTHPEYTSASMERVVVENVSLLLVKKMSDDGGGETSNEPLVTISGMVSGINEQQKPEEGGLLPIALVETTHPYPNGRFATPTPTMSSVLLEDGPYELMALPGQFGIVVSFGLVPIDVWTEYQDETINYWAFRRQVTPRAMGYTPFLSGYPGDVLDDVHVNVDRPRLGETNVSLNNPPGGGGQGPNSYLARAILDLGSDGYFDLGVEAQGDGPNMPVYGLPHIEDWPDTHVRMRWEGEAFITPDENIMANRLSWSTITTDSVEASTVIGPFLPTTEVVVPEFEAVALPPIQVQWIEHPGVDSTRTQEIPHLHYLNLSNQDGLLWTGWLPGALSEFTPPLQELASLGQLNDLNLYYLSIFSALAVEPFTFDDFTFADLGRLRAYSWSFTRFSDGELPVPE